MIGRTSRRSGGWPALALSLVATGCAAGRLPIAIRPAGLPAPTAVLYLIGDAGAARSDLPVLRQLRDDIARQPIGAPVVVAFLGDNVYEAGVRDASDPGFSSDSVRLESQVGVVRGTRASGLFLPGNHDWADGGPEGVRRLRNQAEFIARRAREGVDVTMAPRDGCPGPVVRDVGAAASLILLDTQWWLQNPAHRINLRCPNQSEEDILEDLRGAIDSVPADRAVIVLGHHPLVSFGPHGGYFSARQILFPLTEVVSWLYVPVPFVLPAARTAGISNQDLSGPRYGHLREAIAAAFRLAVRPPTFYAAGHEHSLQISDGRDLGIGLHLVSGAGSKLTHVTDAHGADFVVGRGAGELGFMRVEFFDDGSFLVSAFTDGTNSCGGDGAARECGTAGAIRQALA